MYLFVWICPCGRLYGKQGHAHETLPAIWDRCECGQLPEYSGAFLVLHPTVDLS